MTIQENVPLAPLTTLQVGGSARYFAELRREDDVREAAQFAKARGLPLFVLGAGSNLLVADAGWPGLVLRIAIGGITTQSTNTPGNAVARRSARSRARNTAEQRHADRPRRRRLPQRRIVLQESCAQRGTVQRPGRARRIERTRNSQLPRSRCPTQSFGGMAGGALGVRQGICGGPGRDLAQTRPCAD